MIFRRLIFSFTIGLVFLVAQASHAQDIEYETLDASSLNKLADEGDAFAAYTLAFNALLDLDGKEVTISDQETILRLLERADAMGDGDAANMLGTIYARNTFENIQIDMDRARSAFKRGTQRGSEGAILNYGVLLIQSENNSNHREGINLLESILDSEVTGHIAAEFLLSVYMFGVGEIDAQFDKIESTALRCVDVEHMEGHCSYIIARDKENGWGQEEDPEGALIWYERSAKNGDERAQWIYGMALLNGEGLEQNSAEAFKWVKASADQGYIDGLISFAVMSATGDGTSVDSDAAFNAYDRAAKLGSAHALRGLSAMLYSGEGRTANEEKGLAGLIIAMDRGDELSLQLISHFLDISEEFELLGEIQKKRDALAPFIEDIKASYAEAANQ